MPAQNSRGCRVKRRRNVGRRLDAPCAPNDFKVKRQAGKRVLVPGVRRQKPQVKRELKRDQRQRRVHQRDVGRKRAHVAQRIERPVGPTGPQQDNQRHKSTSQLLSCCQEERPKEADQKRRAPGGQRVVAGRIGVVARPLGVGKAKAKDQVVQVVGKHQRHKCRRDAGARGPNRVPRPCAVDGRRAQGAGQAQRGDRAHGDVVAIPQRRRQPIAAHRVLDQHQQHPQANQGGDRQKVAADGLVGAAQMDRDAPDRDQGAKENHVAGGCVRALRQGHGRRRGKGSACLDGKKGRGKDGRHRARNNEHLLPGYVFCAHHGPSIAAGRPATLGRPAQVAGGFWDSRACLARVSPRMILARF